MVVTEYLLRNKLKGNNEKKYTLFPGDILTPSARQLLTDRGVEIIKVEEQSEKTKLKEPKTLQIEKIVEEKIPKFRGLSGEYYLEKGEKMTHLRGDIIVPKNNKRIVLRGKIDNLLAEWLITHKSLSSLKNSKLNGDLDSVYGMIRKIMTAEIKNELLENIEVLGYSMEKTKEISHNPKKHFGVDHLFLIDSTYSDEILQLNRIRTLVRMCELSAMDSFYDSYGEKENKMMEAFNRLSSAVYIMMLKGKSGEYGNR